MELYCLKCKKKTSSTNIAEVVSKNNRKQLQAVCEVCGAKKSAFLAAKTGNGVINTVLNKIPMPEMHLSLPPNVQNELVPNGSFNNTGKYSYCGPFTKVDKRVAEGYEGVNDLDKACKVHDLAYKKGKNTKSRNIADDQLAQEAASIANNPNRPDYVRKDARTVTAVMATKSRFGMGFKKI